MRRKQTILRTEPAGGSNDERRVAKDFKLDAERSEIHGTGHEHEGRGERPGRRVDGGDGEMTTTKGSGQRQVG